MRHRPDLAPAHTPSPERVPGAVQGRGGEPEAYYQGRVRGQGHGPLHQRLPLPCGHSGLSGEDPVRPLGRGPGPDPQRLLPARHHRPGLRPALRVQLPPVPSGPAHRHQVAQALRRRLRDKGPGPAGLPGRPTQGQEGGRDRGRPGRVGLRLPPGPDGLQEHHFRVQLRRRGYGRHGHPRLPAAPGDPAEGDRPGGERGRGDQVRGQRGPGPDPGRSPGPGLRRRVRGRGRPGIGLHALRGRRRRVQLLHDRHRVSAQGGPGRPPAHRGAKNGGHRRRQRGHGLHPAPPFAAASRT